VIVADLFAPEPDQLARREAGNDEPHAFMLDGHCLYAVTEDGWAAMRQARSGSCQREACGSIRLNGQLHIILSDTAEATTRRAAADVLTRREMQIARCIAQGDSNKEIARHLGISHLTVREHVRRICAKLALHGRAAVAARIGAEQAHWLL
jgi:DNA-binding NarL/FixJ family response regulator